MRLQSLAFKCVRLATVRRLYYYARHRSIIPLSLESLN